ncbi:hypothetical protein BDR22DRAFT_883966 [Usnea florida]
MAASSDVDAATEALIAQLMAEDLGESYYRHSAPIGASYDDYEEPLSSYERQCLDAEDNPEGGSGWGPKDPDEVNSVATVDESPSPNGLADHGTWDSSYRDEHGVQQTAAPSSHAETSGNTSESNENKEHCDTDSSDQESLVSSSQISHSPPNVSHDLPSKVNNISPHATDSTESPSCLWSVPVQVPQDHLDDATSISTSPLSGSHPPAVGACEEPSTTQPPTTGQEVEDRWDDGLDYSSAKGKGKAVRAYDEFKLGLRKDHSDGWIRHDAEIGNGDCDTEDEDEDEADIDDEDLPFIRIPWPSVETEELLSRREDAEVAEIRVGDDETLESILRDINVREEERRKEKAVEETRERQMGDVLGRKVVASW